MTIQKFERRKCDRCKTADEMPDDNVMRQWTTVGFPMFNGRGFHSEADMPPTFDLCPDCRGSLIDWWRSGVKS